MTSDAAGLHSSDAAKNGSLFPIFILSYSSHSRYLSADMVVLLLLAWRAEMLFYSISYDLPLSNKTTWDIGREHSHLVKLASTPPSLHSAPPASV
jgi:hypothetical protein